MVTKKLRRGLHVVKRIKKTGWPVFTPSGHISKRYLKAHTAANRATLKAKGSKVANAVNRIKVPSNELLGSHTKGGNIIVSKRVPKKLRSAIAYHERVEHKLMIKKK